jgi:hypothetical protein
MDHDADNQRHGESMFESEMIAANVSDLMLEFGARLDASVELVMKNCGTEEFQQYRTAVAKVMAEMLLEIMNPVYAQHPNLRPKQLR